MWFERATLGLVVATAIGGATACGRIGFDRRSESGSDAGAGVDGSAAGDAATLAVDPCAFDVAPAGRAAECAAVEAQILAGDIASVTDTALIAWARAGCMRKPAPAFAQVPVATAFTVEPGDGPDCSAGAPPGSTGVDPDWVYDGSGTLDLGSFSGTCGPTNLRGTYDAVRFATVSTSMPVSSHQPGCRTLHASAISGAATLRAFDTAMRSVSPFPLVLLADSMQGRSQVLGGAGDDVVILTGDAGGDLIDTLAGNDTVVIGGGLLVDDRSDSLVRLGDGDDVFLVYDLGIAAFSPDMDVFGGPGADAMYVNDFRIEDFDGGGGDDVISCTGLFGTPSCEGFSEWGTLTGGAGNDIISVDGPLVQTPATGGATEITGDAGFNIIYVASIDNAATSDRIVICPTTTGSSLLVLGGDHRTATASTVDAPGADNVLLVEASATNDGFAFTGFARTLRY